MNIENVPASDQVRSCPGPLCPSSPDPSQGATLVKGHVGLWLRKQLHRCEGEGEENTSKKKQRRKRPTPFCSIYHSLPSPVDSGPLGGLRVGPCGLHIFSDNRTRPSCVSSGMEGREKCTELPQMTSCGTKETQLSHPPDFISEA